ncbi:MAG TPA: hypothetical protein VHQ47_14475 [Phycisphaerae bacterium]|nr:hypothetical protein [Phycisphaerae bacterium]
MLKTYLTSLLLILFAASATRAADAAPALADSAPAITVTLGTVAKMKLAPAAPLTAAQQQRIKDLISAFTQLDQPDFGLSPTLSGTSFSPLGQSSVSTMVLADHHIEPSKALTELVSVGPDALPFLLDALDDQRVTRIVITHDSGFGSMWFGGERDRNPLNPAEVSQNPPPHGDPFSQPPVRSYTVKVGDVCFVAVGQIVGRAYEAVRYQPTANIVINSTTQDPQLCAEVRAAWTSNNPRQKVLDSLLIDYATQGVFNGTSLDGWYDGSDRQCTAARLLLFYFSQQTAPLIAPRLAKLDVRKDSPDINETMRRWVAQGIRPDAFISAVAWSSEPAIRNAISGIFQRTDNVDCLLAALPAVQDKGLERQRLAALIDALPPDDKGPYGDANRLTALIPLDSDAARRAAERYLKHDTLARRLTLCMTLKETRAPWAPQILGPMLTDTRDTQWGDYAINPSENEPRLPIRICDVAAQTLAANRSDLHFKMEGSHENLDRQIGVLKSALAGSPTTRPN